ncbi:MAG: aspartate aminotransferase family protein [Alphaproteobacteria bacterium]|jgi:glutamate-1-semialdehyde 2,1-aminomutase|nr:aspartate aminotransferase family protein [Alphaproteobacteria bacterium]
MTDAGTEGGGAAVGRLAEMSAAEEAHAALADSYISGRAHGTTYMPDDVRFVVERGQGARVMDESGNWYVDYVIGAGAMILGHTHPAVEAATIGQIRRGTHFYSLLNGPAMELATEIVAASPCADKVMYTTTGSEATFYALRLARAYTGRDKVLKFEGAYHGSHDYSLVSSAPSQTSNYPVGQLDTGGVPTGLDESVLIAPYNDLDAAERIVAENADDIAAIIVEPIQRILTPEPGFLAGLRAVADKHDSLLLFDEVVTGFRLAYGGAQEYYDVRPDLASYGKVVGGGFAQGAVAGREEVMDLTDPTRKGQGAFAYVNGTFNGNPVAAVAALATLEVLRQPGTYERLNQNTAQLRTEMQAILDRHDLPALVIGDASMWQILFTDTVPRNYAQYIQADMARTKALDEALIRHGVLVLPLVRRNVSVAHDEDDFEATLRALDAACREVA